MASSFNLVRNSRVFFTTNVDASTGAIPTSGASITTSNTFEIQVLDGFSFSQGTQQSVIQISEAGSAPVRGQRAFNTQLDPVDFTFSTYIRPYLDTGNITAEEQYLWNALLSSQAITATGIPLTITGFTRTSNTTTTATVVCSSVDLTANGIALNDTFAIGKFTPTTVTNVTSWEGAVKLVTIAGTMAAATNLVIEYQNVPPVAAGVTLVTATGAALFKCAWVPQATAATTPAHSVVHVAGSNVNQLQKFGMIFSVDGIIYAVDNCAMDQASVEFGLDGIAMIAWTGKGTALRALPNATLVGSVFGGTGNATGTAKDKVTAANYITGKLSTVQLIGGIQGGGTVYTMALTGGNITISNNINYITPAILGIVNKPIGYFTGSRSITGNMTAYLRTGGNNSSKVLDDILTANASETKFKGQIEVGGLANAIRVEFKMNGLMLQVPTVETADVMSTTINFTAQGYDPLVANASFDLERVNDIQITYYSS